MTGTRLMGRGLPALLSREHLLGLLHEVRAIASIMALYGEKEIR